ncbi:MAG: ferrous iron transport protein A [Firmicutes bacterium]|nr:ferrous iron transport protein A [Bacillota bacterium]
MIYTLADMPMGTAGMIMRLKAQSSTRRRLLDLGLVPGTVVRYVRQSPLGDPIAFDIRGAVVALRKVDAQTVFVDPVKE